MDIIGIPHNLPSEFRLCFANIHNENLRLREELNLLRRILFGRKTEKFICGVQIEPNQTLFNEVEVLAEQKNSEETKEQNSSSEQRIPNVSLDKENKKKRKKSNDKDDEIDPSLVTRLNKQPREIKVHDLSDKQKICPMDGTPLKTMSKDIVEKIDVIPVSFKIIEHHYLKYSCPCCQKHVVKPKVEPAVIPASIAEPGLLAHVALHKYHLALPLYRQEAFFRQMGVELSRTTLARWMIACGEVLTPIANEIKKYILSLPSFHCDETPVQVLKGTGRKSTSKSYMWVMASSQDPQNKNAFYFNYFKDRTQESALHFLTGAKNSYIQVDGYSGYNAVFQNPNLKRVACWAHVRRKFDSALKDGSQNGQSLACQFMTLINELFIIERELKEKSSEERLILRKQTAPPVIKEIRALVDNNINKVPPRCKLGNAISYLTSEWDYLQEFLNHGLVSLSNNRVENAIRPFAIGRKNWLFSDSVKGAQASAVLYSIITTAKENDLDIEAYLEDLCIQLPKIKTDAQNNSIEHLLPWNWKK